MAMPAISNSSAGPCPDLVSAVYEAKRRQIRAYPQKSNRASECGHPCERYLVLSRTRWQEKVLHGPDLEFIFQGGRMIEDMARAELRDAGLEITEQQRAFEWPVLQLTGHLDCMVRIDGGVYPLEVKGLAHHSWQQINSVQDMLNSPRTWMRKYPAQLTMYLLSANAERGLFYIKSKQSYAPKVIWLDLDYAYAETICKKLERVNAHVAAGTLPEAIDEPDVCEDCGFLAICLPEVKGRALEIVDNPRLIELLERREALAAARTEYETVDKELKDALKDREKLLVGDWLITGKEVQRRGYTVADSSYWQSKIARLVPGRPSVAAGA
jgi:CRISPR/Cas system-associated exonuclease Cas4 (RecB family)